MKETKYPRSAREEEVKASVAKHWFDEYDTTKFIGNIDFAVAEPETSQVTFMRKWLLWAEAKKGTSYDIDDSFVQLILTIGHDKTSEREIPPRFLGVFDAGRVAFLPFHEIHDVFNMNDFNWNVAPSNHKTREFLLLKKRVSGILASGKLTFDYIEDESELRKFIRKNFARTAGSDVTKIQITKNNFTHIYHKWRAAVKPTIAFSKWDEAKKKGIIDADFFLADLLSQENSSIQKSLNVLLHDDHYRRACGKDDLDQLHFAEIHFRDGLKAHIDFWQIYERPPKKEYWDYIVKRRDLLVPQDVRETKGAFFTPRQWVELSQEYLARALGEDWQDEYYIWDCCAGTGNLLAGLVNKKNIWASTLERQDVDVMLQRIENMNKGLAKGDDGANLFPSHVFQFDFLNDPFTKLPKDLQEIIKNPKKRQKLVIYINPPYAEGDNRRGEGRSGVAADTMVATKYATQMGYGKRELFVQFLMRINEEIRGCVLGEFSTLKILQGPKFGDVRQSFRPELRSVFLVPADTFDNVKGQFPIGFKIWNTARQVDYTDFVADVYDAKGNEFGQKTLFAYEDEPVINDWIVKYASNDYTDESMGTIIAVANDFQNRGTINLCEPNKKWNHKFQWQVEPENVNPSCVYFSVRLCMAATWLNDRDQFLYPFESWKKDLEFQRDCLAYTLFHAQNRIRSADGVNHWVPFSEEEAGTRDEIKSHFMIDLLKGKTPFSVSKREEPDVFAFMNPDKPKKRAKTGFSREARAVLNAALPLYRYYHARPDANPNASFYDIRQYFQGVDEKGRMNSTSGDDEYNRLLAALRLAQKDLAAKIAEGVYRHGFLK